MHNFDVLIIGAGISGIGAACHLSRQCPSKRVAILERRKDLGGTWDLFKYPGIRSDSDMFTFGYNFRPWTDTRTLADGPSIKQYVTDTAREHGVDKKIHFGRKVTGASWDSDTQQWTISVTNEASGEAESWTTRFIMLCTGYYNYDRGYRPEFPGEEDFKGPIVHPQHWPEDLDYTGKRVVIIGSGATAVTLLPAMAEDTAHITMLQRTPTYILPLPGVDPMARRLMGVLPEMVAYRLMRSRNIAMQWLSYVASRTFPEQTRNLILRVVRRQLRGKVGLEHFTPDYYPWDQRMCVVPDGDLFRVLRNGRASIVTDHIDRFTEHGIRLKSGRELEADIIVTATGLDLQMLGGMTLNVDGKPHRPQDGMLYKSVLIEGVPNAAMVIGYINASWTLRADLAAEYLCRLIKHMDRNGYAVATPVDTENSKTDETVMGSLKSGYIQRATDRMPRQGSHGPWRLTHDYYRDITMLRKAPIEDGYLRFERLRVRPASDRPQPERDLADPVVGVVGR